MIERSQLWLPGAGLVPPHIQTAMKALQEYDADLLLGRDERNGDWVVLMETHREIGPRPVMRLGPELPGVDEIKRKLYMGDTRKRGHKITADIVRAHDREQARMRAATHDGAGEVAEAMDAMLHIKNRHPVPRIFVPGGKD